MKTLKLCLLAALSSLGFLASSAWADPLNTWTIQTNGLNSEGNNFIPLSVAYGNGVFVAVGQFYVATSKDGTNWTTQLSSTSTINPFRETGGRPALEQTVNYLTGVTFGNGRFVAYGSGYYNQSAFGTGPLLPVAVTSTNGTDWTGVELEYPAGPYLLEGITFGNGEFIVAETIADNSFGTAPGIYVQVAPDGLNWGEYGTTSFGINKQVNNLAYGYVTNGNTVTPTFAAATYSEVFSGSSFTGTGALGLLTSPDAFNWSVDASQVANLIFYANGLWIAPTAYAPRSVFSSGDLTTWYPGTTSDYDEPGPMGLAYGSGNIVSVSGDGGTIDSAAWAQGPLNWTHRYTVPGGLGYGTLNGIAYGNGLWVAVGAVTKGNQYVPAAVTAGGIIQPYRIPVSSVISQIIAALKNELGIGRNGIITVIQFTNGMHYALQTPTTNNLFGIASALNNYVAVGAHGTILSSVDSTNWTLAVSPTTNLLYGVASGNGVDIAVGAGGTVLRSTDDIDWGVAPTLGASDLIGLTFGNGQFEAIAANGAVYTSSTGTNWSPEALVLPGTVNRLTSISFADGQYTGTDAAGDVLSSPDGKQWTIVVTGSPATGVINSATLVNGTLVMAGASSNVLTVQFPVAGTGTDRELNGVTWSGSTYVAVGGGGVVIKSSDGGHWTMPSNYFGTPNALYAVTYGGGQFVGVGQNSWIVTSPDGDNWNSTSSGVNAQDLRAITYGNGVYVAVGNQGAILSSPDGLNWNVETNGTDESFYGVTFAGGKFVMTGNADSFTSVDGIHWTAGSSGLDGGIQGLCAGNGLFVAATSYGEIFTSYDGVNWAQQAEPNVSLYDVSFGGGYFVATSGQGTAFVSPNGTNWTEIQTDDGDLDLYAGVGGNSEFVLVGEGGVSVSAAYSELAALPQATPWNVIPTPTTTPGGHTLQGVAYNGEVYTIVGTVPECDLVSYDGLSWTNAGNGLESLPSGVTWGHGVFVEVDYYGNIYTSPDGTNWTQRAGTGYDLYAVAYGGGMYVATTDNGIVITSPDSIHWSPRHTPLTGSINAITYGNGQFVAVADDGSAATSANGTMWTPQTTPSPRALLGVTWGDKQYVAVGSYGAIVTSPDGVNWTLQTNAPYNVNALHSVVWGNNEFMAVGQGGWALRSPDGVKWISTTTATYHDLYSVIYANGSFLAVGDENTIIRTPGAAPFQPGSLKIMPNGTVVGTMSGTAGNTYNIQVSSDLLNWTTLSTVSLSSTNGQFIDSSALLRPTTQKYYRVALQP